jgi:hypothetical protein
MGAGDGGEKEGKRMIEFSRSVIKLAPLPTSRPLSDRECLATTTETARRFENEGRFIARGLAHFYTALIASNALTDEEFT